MAVTKTELSLVEIADEQSNRFDQKRYIAEKRFQEFISEFDETEPLRYFTEEIRNGQDFKTTSYSPVETDIMYISVNQVSSGILGEFYWDDVTYLDVNDEQIEVEAQDGDILITRSGSYPGIAWNVTQGFLDTHGRIVPSGFIQRLRLKESAEMEPEFVTAYLNSPPVKMLTQAFACGKEQLNISQEYIKSIPVPIVSNDVREGIIDNVSEYKTRIGKVQKLIEELQIRQGQNIISMLSKSSEEVLNIPEIPDIELQEEGATSKWGLPIRRGQRESSFYVESIN